MVHSIGIDFDNTIVCYDEIFHQAAFDRALIPADFPKHKEKIRNHLRNIGNEDAWTALQGWVYGERMVEAKAFPGVKNFIQKALQQAITIYIISHKTRYPYLGPAYDLHAAAYEWLSSQAFFTQLGLPKDQVFFLESKSNKCQKIAEKNCQYFIDDLPELLFDEHFPAHTQRILFAPDPLATNHPCIKLTSWQAIDKFFFPV